MQYVIRRKVAGDPHQLSAWFRPKGWIIAPEAAAFFGQRSDAEAALAKLAVDQPTSPKGKAYEYSVEERRHDGR